MNRSLIIVSSFFIHSYSQLLLLFEVELYCLDSEDFIRAVHHLPQTIAPDPIDHYLLVTCWQEMFHPTSDSVTKSLQPVNDDAPQQLYERILTRLEHELNQPSILNVSSLTYIFQRCEQLLLIRPLPSFDHHASIIFDHLIDLLQTPNRQQSRILVALEALQRLSTHPDFRPIMQQRQISTHLLPFTNDHQHERQRTLALAILAQVIDEKQLTATDQMMSVFIDQLQHIDPRRYNAELDTTLASLQGKTTKTLTCSL